VGLVAALVATPFLIVNVLQRGDGLFIIGAIVFIASVILLYFASTVYHAWPRGKAKHVFRIIEHGAIFLMIAGTYTPFTLGVLRGVWGWTLNILIWTLAISGVLLKTVRGVRNPRISLALYVGMGWLLVVAIRPLWLRLPFPGMMWLVAGGLCYTVGVVFFTTKRMRYAHFVWHLFVLAGTACHFIAVGFYAG
jgi:hemolysin III